MFIFANLETDLMLTTPILIKSDMFRLQFKLPLLAAKKLLLRKLTFFPWCSRATCCSFKGPRWLADFFYLFIFFWLKKCCTFWKETRLSHNPLAKNAASLEEEQTEKQIRMPRNVQKFRNATQVQIYYHDPSKWLLLWPLAFFTKFRPFLPPKLPPVICGNYAADRRYGN